MMMNLLRLLAAVSACLVFVLPVQAAPYSSVYAFGDSLSDNGNFFSLTGEPAAPYVDGRFSNGPVAVERLASRLGVPLFDFAVGGADSSFTNSDVPPAAGALYFTGVRSQIDHYVGLLGGASADPSALYFVWGGANDFLHGDLSDPSLIAAAVIFNLKESVLSLYGAGARKFLLPLLPDLGLTPEALAAGPAVSGFLSFVSAEFDAALAASYGLLEASLPGAVLTVFDTLGAQHDLLAHASDYGLTNASDACYTGFVGVPGDVCASPDSYFFWDLHHPTALVHRILGDEMTAAVPEPASAALVALGLLLISTGRRRRA